MRACFPCMDLGVSGCEVVGAQSASECRERAYAVACLPAPRGLARVVPRVLAQRVVCRNSLRGTAGIAMLHRCPTMPGYQKLYDGNDLNDDHPTVEDGQHPTEVLGAAVNPYLGARARPHKGHTTTPPHQRYHLSAPSFTFQQQHASLPSPLTHVQTLS